MGNGGRVAVQQIGESASLRTFSQGDESSPGAPSPVTGIAQVLQESVAALDSIRSHAAEVGRSMDLSQAADFAGSVEEISRSLEYFQVVAARAVDRTRREAEQMEPSLDDGYRNAAEFLRGRLRIGIGEARRRLTLGVELLPHDGIVGQPVTPRHEELADAVASALVPSRSATIISMALDKITHFASPDTIAAMEHALTQTAIRSDPDFVTRIAKRWTDAIDQDGPEPSEEALRQLQGAFIRKPRYGLHHLEIFATSEQFETLTTVMNAATNPRLRGTAETTAESAAALKEPTRQSLDLRSRAQKLLDGLAGACNLALATGQLPANGGLRPQVTVTIDYRDLLQQLNRSHEQQDQSRGVAIAPQRRTGATASTGTASFTGPIHPNTIRKLACDAEIVPVVLGSESRVLDIGRTTRIFPPHIRKAITARDAGCAFPDCTMPAPWCEAHHITYWSRGGSTSADNGTLLCSHHHHLIHKEKWKITITQGVPWFVPPPHVDPGQTPRRNHHHTPLRT